MEILGHAAHFFAGTAQTATRTPFFEGTGKITSSRTRSEDFIFKISSTLAAKVCRLNVPHAYAMRELSSNMFDHLSLTV